MSLAVHDELVNTIHLEELHLIPKIKEIMEGVYPYKHLPMTVGMDVGVRNWQDKVSFEQFMKSGEIC